MPGLFVRATVMQISAALRSAAIRHVLWMRWWAFSRNQQIATLPWRLVKYWFLGADKFLLNQASSSLSSSLMQVGIRPSSRAIRVAWKIPQSTLRLHGPTSPAKGEMNRKYTVVSPKCHSKNAQAFRQARGLVRLADGRRDDMRNEIHGGLGLCWWRA